MNWTSLLNTNLSNKDIRKLMLKYTTFDDLIINFQNLEEDIKIKLDKLKEYKIESDVRVISYYDSEYPDYLRDIKDFPVFLFLKGRALNIVNSVAVVGTRNNTKLGEKTCQEIVKGFELYENISIISGMAKGIDSIAHITAIKNNINTVAVLPTNIYDCYPYENKLLKEQITEYGTIISEFRPEEKLNKYNFVIRNRIIAALSRAVCIVEAPKKSGAVITAKFAENYNREIYATPSNIFDKNFFTCNDLIMKNKAKLIMSADDIAYEYGWRKNEKISSDS